MQFYSLKVVFQIVVFFLLVLENHVIVGAQPVNNDCLNAIDISDGAWYPGDNNDATYSCSQDLRSADCYSGTTGCPSPDNLTNPTDMCCGIEGIESSIWYKFKTTSAADVYVDFRNISCSPTNFFGITTSLQGFILRRLNSSPCLNPCKDTVKDCFDAGNINDIDGQMYVRAQANQFYYIEIDSRKNTFSGCGTCASPSPTCHSDCIFEIRIRVNDGTVPVRRKIFKGNNQGEVVARIKNDWAGFNFFRIRRVELSNEPDTVWFAGERRMYMNYQGDFEYTDVAVQKSGTYEYMIELSENGKDYLEFRSEVLYVKADEKVIKNIVFLPASEKIVVELDQELKKGLLDVSVQSLQGQVIARLPSQSQDVPNSLELYVGNQINQMVIVQLRFVDHVVRRRVIITH